MDIHLLLFYAINDITAWVRRQAYRRLYLRSRHWRVFADEMRDMAGHRCEQCHAIGVRLDVHHTTYSRIGRETWRDVVVLCRACHEAAHAGDVADAGDVAGAGKPKARRA